MPKKITSIQVTGLWNQYNLLWQLVPGVNILSGNNGSGKSTILRCLVDMFRNGKISSLRQPLVDQIKITFDDQTTVSSSQPFDTRNYNIDVISTFDMGLRESDAINKLSGGEVRTELDWELYRLHTEYLNFQLDMSKDLIASLMRGEHINGILENKILFYDIIDSLFEATGKTINRHDNSLSFTVGCRQISPYQLSSGEKQMLIILTTVLIQRQREVIMLMDEPEISLHFDWQRRLIEDILRLNPNLQLIMATHAPAMAMDGWIDKVTEITELITNNDEI